MRDDIERFFEQLHAMPEGPFAETKTAGFIAERLADVGYRVRAGLAGTGVVADLERVGEASLDQVVCPIIPTSADPAPPENPIVSGDASAPALLALRADMDAMLHSLDGKEVYVHSCGHDAHSTMVSAAGVILARKCPKARGRLRLVFQPAEETGLGAERMIEAGAVEGVDAMFGIHLRPAAECRLGQATPCLVHAGGRTLQYVVKGQPSHTGRPHLGVNAADAVALAAIAVNSVKPDPLACATVNVVGLGAGGPGGKPSGVIPEQGELTVNIRAESDEMADELRVRVDSAVRAAAGSIGAGVWLEREKKMPAPCYDPDMIDIARSAIVAVLGEAGVRERITTPGSEDFHWYARRKAGLRAAYIGLGADFVPGLHHPDATFDRQALVYGAAILAQAAACYFDRAVQA
jgi:amidohydrolase